MLALFSLDPNRDFTTALLVPLCYQAVVVLTGWLSLGMLAAWAVGAYGILWWRLARRENV